MKKSYIIPKKNQAWQTLLKQLSETLESNDRRLNLIQELDHAIQRTTDDPAKVFDILLSEGLKEIGADYGHIMVKVDNDLVIKYSNKSVIGTKLPIDKSLCGTVFKNGQYQSVPDVSKLEHYYEIHKDTQSELAIPIHDSRGIKIFGIFNIEWVKETNLLDEDLNFYCNLLNGQIAITMEQVKLWQGVQLISELSNELLLNIKSLKEVYSLILKRILSILDFDLGQILLVDNKDLIIVASSNQEDINSVVNENNSVCGHYIFGKKGKVPLNINDIDDQAFLEYKEKYKWFLGKADAKKMRSEFVVPLIGSEQNTIGIINIEDPRKDAFSEFDEFVIGIFAKMIASTIDAANEREKKEKIESSRDFDLISIQLADLAIGYLHNFGNKIINSCAGLEIFRDKVLNLSDSLPKFVDVTGIDYLNKIILNLKEASDILQVFRNKTDPKKIDANKKRVNLLIAMQNAIDRVKKSNFENIIIQFDTGKLLGKGRTIYAMLTDQFDEVLNSLLNNAVGAIIALGTFRRHGQIDVSINLVDLKTAEIAIKDNGIGMDKEMQEKAFEFGSSTKKNFGQGMGQGLGLWFVSYYLHRFGAQVTFDSKEGEGTIFYIKIPIIIADAIN